jgi:hypothetical protein
MRNNSMPFCLLKNFGGENWQEENLPENVGK